MPECSRYLTIKTSREEDNECDLGFCLHPALQSNVTYMYVNLYNKIHVPLCYIIYIVHVRYVYLNFTS